MVEDASEIKSGKGLGNHGGSLAKSKGSVPRRPSWQTQSTATTSKNKEAKFLKKNGLSCSVVLCSGPLEIKAPGKKNYSPHETCLKTRVLTLTPFTPDKQEEVKMR